MKKILVLIAAVAALGACAKQNPLKDFDNLPEGMDPITVGNKIAAQLLSTEPYAYQPQGCVVPEPVNYGGYFHYSVISLWTNALEFARKSGDSDLELKLIDMFEPFHAEKKYLCNPTNHVDHNIFGAVPLEIYIINSDRRALELGLHYADSQWAEPDSTQIGPHSDFGYAAQMEFLEKGYTPQTRLWIDDMYMINLIQTQAFRATGDIKYVERAAKEMVLYLDEIQNPDGLFYHSKDVHYIWGRGDGWMAAGMPMILEYLPESNEYYPRILEGYRKMMAALLQYQRENGLWGQLVDDPESWDETSGSAMFTYGFIQGIRHGWLDSRQYGPAARKAWIALCSKFDEYGNIADVCAGTARKNSRDWYMNRPRQNGDPHGQAPMMWICSALVDNGSVQTGPDPLYKFKIDYHENNDPVDYDICECVPGVDNMGWTWWFGPQVWSVNDVRSKLWWGYASTRGQVGVAEYDATGRQFKKTHLKKNNDADDHNNSVVVGLPDGKVGVLYTDGHATGNHVYVRISKAVESIDEFEDAITLDFDGRTTYVQYFYMLGKHYIFTRTQDETYKWAWTCSEDFIHWSEPCELISATDRRYYIKLQKVSDADGVLRITAYGHPTESHEKSTSNIRMGFINFNDGKIYNSDGKTVIANMGDCFYYTELDEVITHSPGKVFRLFDVAITPMSDFTVSLAEFSREVKTDSRYLIYNDGTLHDICAGGFPFWLKSVYLGGISFIDSEHVVLARNDGTSSRNLGNDIVELWDCTRGKWKMSRRIVKEPVGENVIRNIRPIVDFNGRYVLWQRGRYIYTTGLINYELEACIYDLEKGVRIK